MYAFLETIWPISAPSSQPCGATEVDVSGLSGMSLLEWLGEPGPECSDTFDSHGALRRQWWSTCAAVNLRGGFLAWLAAGDTVVDAHGSRRSACTRSNAVPADMEAVW